jgi:hypothetical protein
MQPLQESRDALPCMCCTQHAVSAVRWVQWMQ